MGNFAQYEVRDTKMRRYQIELTGVMPLLMHRDNISGADELRAWREKPGNKKLSVAGDDRTPAFTWIYSLYHDSQTIVVPTDNIMRAIMEGGTQVVVPGGRSGKTFKAQTQSGIQPEELFWPVYIDGKVVPAPEILALREELDFEKHQAVAVKNGFSLDVKRARIGQSKHIRVRPRFDRWVVGGVISVHDDQITTQVLESILDVAGKYKGLGDWRPSSRTPGPFGRFSATAKEIKQ